MRVFCLEIVDNWVKDGREWVSGMFEVVDDGRDDGLFSLLADFGRVRSVEKGLQE